MKFIGNANEYFSIQQGDKENLKIYIRTQYIRASQLKTSFTKQRVVFCNIIQLNAGHFPCKSHSSLQSNISSNSHSIE